MNKQDQKIEYQLTSLLLSSGKKGAIINCITSGYVAWYLYMTMEKTLYLFVWLGLIYFFSAVRFVISFKAELDENRDRRKMYQRLFTLNIFINGLLWGSVYPIYYQDMAVFQQFFVIMIMVAGVTISIISLAANRLCFYLFALPVLLPLWLISVMGLSVDDYFFNIGLTMYMIMVSYLFNLNHKKVVANIKLLSQQELLIHDLRMMNERLGVASMTDFLTKLANRGYFSEQLSKDWLRCKRARLQISLLIIDIDFFKEYNDYYGHVQGDNVLQTTADILTKVVVRDTDLSARFGGDEMAVILYNTDEEGAQWVARQIIEEVQQRAVSHEKSPYKQMTVSIGIASMMPSKNNDEESLLVNADRALYDAKSKGRNGLSIHN